MVAGWRGGQMKRRGGAKSGQGLFEDPVPDEGQRSARIKDQDVEQPGRVVGGGFGKKPSCHWAAPESGVPTP